MLTEVTSTRTSDEEEEEDVAGAGEDAMVAQLAAGCFAGLLARGSIHDIGGSTMYARMELDAGCCNMLTKRGAGGVKSSCRGVE